MAVRVLAMVGVSQPHDTIDGQQEQDGSVAYYQPQGQREAEQYTADYKKQAALAALGNKHPDMQQILGDWLLVIGYW